MLSADKAGEFACAISEWIFHLSTLGTDVNK